MEDWPGGVPRSSAAGSGRREGCSRSNDDERKGTLCSMLGNEFSNFLRAVLPIFPFREQLRENRCN